MKWSTSAQNEGRIEQNDVNFITEHCDLALGIREDNHNQLVAKVKLIDYWLYNRLSY